MAIVWASSPDVPRLSLMYTSRPLGDATCVVYEIAHSRKGANVLRHTQPILHKLHREVIHTHCTDTLNGGTCLLWRNDDFSNT